MDFCELDTVGVLVEPSVDWSQVTPIEQPRLLTFVNFWLERHAQFLTNFADRCDVALHEIEGRVNRMDASLMLLEAKLASVAWLNEEGENDVHLAEVSTAKMEEESIAAHDDDVCSASTADVKEESAVVGAAQQPQPQTTADVLAVRQHPLCSRYFRMKQFGISVEATKHKMIQDGVDPSLLDKPDVSAASLGLPDVHSDEGEEDESD